MQMYLDALFDFYREKSKQRETCVLMKYAELESHGLSLDKFKSHEEMKRYIYGKNNLFKHLTEKQISVCLNQIKHLVQKNIKLTLVINEKDAKPLVEKIKEDLG